MIAWESLFQFSSASGARENGPHGEGRSWSAPGFLLKKGEFGGAHPAPQLPDAFVFYFDCRPMELMVRRFINRVYRCIA